MNVFEIANMCIPDCEMCPYLDYENLYCKYDSICNDMHFIAFCMLIDVVAFT